MKIKFHVPTQQYGFLEIEGESEQLKDAEKIYNTYAETPLKFRDGIFVEYDTFTGEKIFYNETTHEYKDANGNKLLSGSQYKKSLEKPFPLDVISGKVATKYGVPSQTVVDMWKANSMISTTFGTALHLAMEQWFKYKASSCDDKEYNVAKHPFLREAVTTFPLKDQEALPEVLISDIANGRVGRIDLLTITGKKEGYIEDYKSDADIDKNLVGHFNQLSFYAHILIEKGWKINGLRVWNYADAGWVKFESEVKELDIKIK